MVTPPVDMTHVLIAKCLRGNIKRTSHYSINGSDKLINQNLVKVSNVKTFSGKGEIGGLRESVEIIERKPPLNKG